MEDKKLPPAQPMSTEVTSETLEYADENKSVASFASASENYPLETLEVHAEGTPTQVAVYAPGMNSVPFSRRKATVVSLIITVIVVLLTGLVAALFVSNDNQDSQAQLSIPTQDVPLDIQAGTSIPELQGTEEGLLVNGDIITRGQLKVTSGEFMSVIRTDELTANHEFVLPNSSGTLCVDANNCNYTPLAQSNQQAAQIAAQGNQLTQLQNQLAQIVVPPAGVTSLNSQAGAVSIQGSTNRVSVTTANGVITISTPQDLDANANVQFGNLTLGAGGSVTANTLQQTGNGNNLNLDAGSDSIVFTAFGRTFEFPDAGGVTQTVCTTSGNCGGGGSAVTDVNGVTNSVTLQGTANQVTVSTGVSTITFSTPQDINTTSSPTFAALTLTGLGNGNVRVSGGVLTTGAINLGTEVTGTLGVGNGGTGLATTPTNGQLLIGNGTGYTVATLTQGAGITVANGAGSITISSTLGTAVDSSEITDGTLLEADLASTNAPTDNYVLTYDQGSGGFTWVDPTVLAGPSVSSLNGLTGALTVQGTAGQVDVADNAADTITLSLDPTVSLLGQTIDLTSEVAGILPVANGGTGASSLNDLIALGTHTTGNYQAGTSVGSGLSVSGVAGEGWTPTINLSLQANKGLEVDANGLSLIDCSLNQVLKYDGSNQWSCASDTVGTGDEVLVNGANADGANFIDSAASATNVAVTWSLNSGVTPDAISLVLGAASGTEAGIVTANSQTFGGAKTFNGQIVANAGINLGSQTLQGTTPIIDFATFDIDASGNTIVAGDFASLSGAILAGSTSSTGTLYLFDGLGSAGILSTAALSNDQTYTLPDASGTICLDSGNCIGGSGGAPNDASYLLTSLDGTLSNERALATGDNISFTDGGANGNFTIATVQNPTFTTSVTSPLFTSSGALTVTPGGAMTLGATGQTALLQGSATTITSNGAGNDITLTSADQIILNGVTDINNYVAIGNSALPQALAGLSVGQTFNSTVDCAAFGCHGLLSSLTANNVSGVNPGLTGVYSGMTVSAGNLFQAAGFYASDPTGAGTITNNYGLFVANQTKGTSDYGVYIQGADTYALWVDAGLSRFDGGLELQGGSPLVLEGATDNGFETTIALVDPTDDRTITLPNASGTVCLVELGNCAGSGGGITGSGTAGRLAVFTGSGTIGDSSISDDGTNVTLNGNVNLDVQGTTLSVGAGSSRTGSLTLRNSTNNNTVTLQSGATSATYTMILPTAVGSANQCLKEQDGTGTLFWDDCEGGAGGTSSVTSLNTLDGDLTVAGTAGQIDVTPSGGTTLTFSLDAAVSLLGQSIGNSEIDNDAVSLGTQTTGNYVATISNGNGISGSSAVEGGAPTIALGPLTANWDQTGAFDIVLNNAGSELQILESTGGTFYGTLDVGDLSQNETYTLLQGGTVLTSGNISSFATTAVTAGAGLTNGGTTGALTLDIGAGNGITVNADDITLALESNKGLQVDSNGLSLIDCGDGEILKYETTGGTWACATDGAGAGGIASLTLAGASGTPQTLSDGDTITIAAGTNISTTVGATDTVTIAVADNPTFSGLVTANGGINLGTQTLQGTTGLIDFTNFDVDGSGNARIGGVLSIGPAGDVVDISYDLGNNLLQVSQSAAIQGDLFVDDGVLTLGIPSITNGMIVFSNNDNGNTGTLGTEILTDNRTYTLPDASGTICLQELGNCSGTAGTLQTAYDAGNTITTTSNRNISFTLADSADDADFIVNMQGTANEIEFRDGGTGFFWATDGGQIKLRPTTDTASAFNITTRATDGNLFTVDTMNSRVGINLGSTNTPDLTSGGLEINGGLRISGGGTVQDTYSTPLGTGLGVKLNIPSYAIGNGSSAIALGILDAGSGANANGTGIAVFDQRTSSTNLRPAIALFSPDENNLLGFSWEGQSTTGYLKADTGSNIGIRINTTDIATFTTSAVNLLQNTAVTGTLSVAHSGSNSERFGASTSATGNNSLAVGNGATANANNATSVGQATSSGSNSVALGTGATANSASSVAIGSGATVDGVESVAIGNGASAGARTISIGQLAANSSRSDGIAIGLGATLGANSSIAIGRGATTTASGQMVIGSGTIGVSDVYIGEGVTDATPTGFTLQATGGSGTDVAGANFTLAGGKGTGNASGGSIVFQTSDAGGSGATLQGLSTKAILLANGNFGIGDTTPAALFTVGTSDAFQINSSGNVQTTGTLTVSGLTTLNGGLTVEAGDTFTFNGEAVTDLTGSGLAVSSGALSLGALTANWNQTGAFDISLNNASSELQILESAGGAFFGIFDVADLTGDVTLTVADGSTGDICTSAGNCFGAGTGNTLQAAYAAGNTIDTTDDRDIVFTLEDTTTDSNFLVDIASGSSGRFAVQNAGTDVLSVESGAITSSIAIQGGTSQGDSLTLRGSNQAWSSGTMNEVEIANSRIVFNGQSSVANGTFPALISFDDTVSLSGASVWGLLGFEYAPTFQQDTSFSFGSAPAFSAGPTIQPTVGGINDSANFITTGFSSGVRHSLNHSGAAGVTGMITGYLDNPFFSRAGGTGTHTITDYAGYMSWAPRIFDNHIQDGYTVTNGRSFWARNPEISGTGSIVNNIGLDVASLSGGTTSNVGVRIAQPSGTGAVALALTGTGGTTASGIRFGTDTNLYRSAAGVLTASGDLSINGGDILSTAGTLNINASGSGTIALQDNTNVTGTLTVSDNVTIDGNLLIDDADPSAGEVIQAAFNDDYSGTSEGTFFQNMAADQDTYVQIRPNGSGTTSALVLTDPNPDHRGYLEYVSDTYFGLVSTTDTSNEGVPITFSIKANGGGINEIMRLDSTGGVSVGNSTLQGAVSIHDGDGETVSLTVDDATAGYTLTLPSTVGAAGDCLKNSGTPGVLTFGSCAGSTSEWTDGGTFLHPADNSGAEDIVIGGTSTGTADIWLQANGAAVFNEQGNDADFRIESDTEANAFFVDGATGSIGLGTNAPDAQLHLVADGVGSDGLMIKDAAETMYMYAYIGGSNNGRIDFGNDDFRIGHDSEAYDASGILYGSKGWTMYVGNNSNSGGVFFRMDNVGGNSSSDNVLMGGFDNNANFFTNLNTTLGDASTDTVTFNARVNSHVLPATDDTYDLGSDTNRWRDLYLGPASLHVGVSGDEGVLSYNTTNNEFEFNQAVAIQGSLDVTGSITSGGPLAIGSAAQTAALQGSTTTISSNGAGNDVTVNSADQIILNAGSTIELQDNTNIGSNFLTGNGIRQFSSSSTVWTFEDTAGNDLMTITDAGTVGNVEITGELTVDTLIDESDFDMVSNGSFYLMLDANDDTGIAFFDIYNDGNYSTPIFSIDAGGSVTTAPFSVTFLQGYLVLGVETLSRTNGQEIEPSASFIELTCATGGGCTLTLDEDFSSRGQTVRIINVGANLVTINDASGSAELAGNWVAGQWDSVDLIYVGADGTGGRWVELSRSDN